MKKKIKMRCNICDKNTLEHGKIKLYPDPDSPIGGICIECKGEVDAVRGEWHEIDALNEEEELKRLFDG